jgi:hypothetical protein
MQTNHVVYQVRRGRNGLPRVVRKQKCPVASKATGRSLSPSAGATPQKEETIVCTHYITSPQSTYTRFSVSP